MANAFVMSRNHLIFGVCLPVAVLLGYLLAEPMDAGALSVLVLVGAVLLFPLLLRYHHLLLILSWNASITPFFLPGRPALWMLMAVLSLGFALLGRSVSDKHGFMNVPALTWSLVCLMVVVLSTALLTGGFGAAVFGSSSYGGKGYFILSTAVMGYFALAGQAIPRQRVNLVIAAFFLPGMTAMVSNLAYTAGPKFYFLYELFPAEYALDQAAAEVSLGRGLMRLSGLLLVAQSVYGYLLARYGILGVFDLARPWRLLLFLGALFAGLFGGFRAGLILFGMIFLTLFFVEGLWRTRALWMVIGLALLVAVLTVSFVDRMPLSVQRTLSFLPVDVDPAIKQSAKDSTEWRLEMWKLLWPEVPKYLFRGKGYALDPQALFIATEASLRGYASSYEWAAYAGDYHNGLLSVIIPFGLYGGVAFLVFLGIGIRVLHNNFRYGAPHLRAVNSYLLAMFIARAVYFFLIFGAFYSELFYFTGALGLSVALNHGERRAALEFEDSPG